MFAEGVIDLVSKGVITNKHKVRSLVVFWFYFDGVLEAVLL